MTSLLLGCGALCSDRLRKRHQVRKEDKKEYATRFEEFKAENQRYEARRQSFRNSFYDPAPVQLHSETDPATNPMVDTTNPARGTPGAVSLEKPPSYDVATGRAGIDSPSVSLSSRSSSTESTMSNGARNGRTMRPLIEQTETQRSTAISPNQHIAARDMATT